jgi:hypothetical protein
MILENAHKLSGFVNLVAGSAHLQDGQRLDKRIGSISPGRDHDLFSRLVNNTSLPRGTSTNRPGHQKNKEYYFYLTSSALSGSTALAVSAVPALENGLQAGPVRSHPRIRSIFQ